MLHYVAIVLIVFQRFTTVLGNSMQHECDMEGAVGEFSFGLGITRAGTSNNAPVGLLCETNGRRWHSGARGGAQVGLGREKEPS
jgi:hypothetical protein